MGPLYDSIATVWLGHGDMPYIPAELSRAPIDQALWDEFWPALESAKTVTYTPATVVARVAGLPRRACSDLARGTRRRVPGEEQGQVLVALEQIVDPRANREKRLVEPLVHVGKRRTVRTQHWGGHGV